MNLELSAARITLKKQSLPSSSIDVPASSCYQAYDEIRKRIQTLSLPSCWDICLHDNYTVLQCKDNIHSVPKFEIFTGPSVSFTDTFCGAYQIIMKFVLNMIILLKM